MNIKYPLKFFKYIDNIMDECKSIICIKYFIAFIIGYILALIGITLEDYLHGIKFSISLLDIHHHIFPIIFGLIFLGFFKILNHYVLNLKTLTKKNKENKKFLRLLINTIPVPIFYKNIKGVYLDCNEEFAQNILGLSKKEIIGKDIFQFPDKIPSKLAETYFHADNSLLKTGKDQVYEAKVKTTEGHIKNYTFYKSILYDDKFKKLGIVGVMLDVTDKTKLNELLEKKVITDSLTNLFNRRYFDEIIQKEIARFERYKIPFSLIIIDIDNFKNYNDTFGHIEGDNVLIEVGKIITKSLRKSDLLFRFGGEEFVVILPNTKLLSGKDFGERLVNKIQDETSYLVLQNKLKKEVTISAGIDEFNENFNLDSFVKEVDKKLYLAKKRGKNNLYF